MLGAARLVLPGVVALSAAHVDIGRPAAPLVDAAAETEVPDKQQQLVLESLVGPNLGRCRVLEVANLGKGQCVVNWNVDKSALPSALSMGTHPWRQDASGCMMLPEQQKWGDNRTWSAASRWTSMMSSPKEATVRRCSLVSVLEGMSSTLLMRGIVVEVKKLCAFLYSTVVDLPLGMPGFCSIDS